MPPDKTATAVSYVFSALAAIGAILLFVLGAR